MPTVALTIRIPADLLAAIDEKCAPGERTRWIVEACRSRLGVDDPNMAAAVARILAALPEIAISDLSHPAETPREVAPVNLSHDESPISNLSHPPKAKRAHPKSAPRPQSPGKVFGGPIPKAGKK